MGETTISWTHTVTPDGTVYPGFTFNAWIGCTKTSPGCANCYAERLNKRFGWNKAGWGPNSARKRTSQEYWRKPWAWDAKARKTGVRLKVFGDSLCDICDDHKSIPQDWREDYVALIRDTPNLDWLWLTKHPDKFNAMWLPLFGDRLPKNLWVGVTAENQEMWDKRRYYLMTIPAAHYFISAEPLLGHIDFRLGVILDMDKNILLGDVISQVIVGGESGPNARPMQAEWALNIRDQCKPFNLPFYFKQVGGNTRINGIYGGDLLDGKEYKEMPR